MFFPKLFSKKKSILGVDIGTSSIKIAQIAHGETAILETYGIVDCPYQLAEKNDEAAIPAVAKLIKTLLVKAGVSTKRCVISFPNIAVFSSVVDFPLMSESELASAVEHEAKKYVPLALSDIDLSWTIVAGKTPGEPGLKVLLTAVPKQITKNYLKVFELAGLSPEVGEIEGLALIRSLVGSQPSNCVIIDIGAKVTGLNIIERGFLRLSRNLNIGGDTITAKIGQELNLGFTRAEQYKKDFGAANGSFIPDAIKPILNVIKTETKQLLNFNQSQSKEKLERIILAGGGAQLPGIAGFFADLQQVKVELGEPLQALSYNKSQADVVKRYALSLPVAIGLALREG